MQKADLRVTQDCWLILSWNPYPNRTQQQIKPLKKVILIRKYLLNNSLSSNIENI